MKTPLYNFNSEIQDIALSREIFHSYYGIKNYEVDIKLSINLGNSSLICVFEQNKETDKDISFNFDKYDYGALIKNIYKVLEKKYKVEEKIEDEELGNIIRESIEGSDTQFSLGNHLDDISGPGEDPWYRSNSVLSYSTDVRLVIHKELKEALEKRYSVLVLQNS